MFALVPLTPRSASSRWQTPDSLTGERDEGVPRGPGGPPYLLRMTQNCAALSSASRPHHREIRGQRPPCQIYISARIERHTGGRVGAAAAQVCRVQQGVSGRAEFEQESVAGTCVRRLESSGGNRKVRGICVAGERYRSCRIQT